MRSIYVVAACCTVVATEAAAQGRESSDVQLRNDCRLAAQIVRTGHPAPHRDWAFGMIRQCGESGPQALADRWRDAPPTNQDELSELASATRAFRTREVFDAVATVAGTPAADQLARVYAIALLQSYAHPGTSLSIEDLLHPPQNGRPPRIYASSHDQNPDDPGTLEDVEEEVEAILTRIVSTEAGSVIARIAAHVLRMV
jgi:hypothetical protein